MVWQRLVAKSLEFHMKKLLVCLLVLLPLHALADPVEDKTRALFEATGTLSTYQSLIAQSRLRAREQARQAADQVIAQLNPSPDFQTKFAGAMDKYIDTLSNGVTAEQIVAVLQQYYASRFTEQELDGLIAFYQSELGKKSIVVGNDAYPYVTQHFKADMDALLASATRDYIKDLQSIAVACNCAKRPVVKKTP